MRFLVTDAVKCAGSHMGHLESECETSGPFRSDAVTGLAVWSINSDILRDTF